MRFVTSMNPLLYEASGRRCVESFARCNPDLTLVAYLEADDADALARMRSEIEATGAHTVALAAWPLLARFEEVAKDVIPRCYGGDAPDADFPGEGPESGDAWFRRGMVRWFRKWVALEHALEDRPAALFWLDCDCHATAPLPADVLGGLLDGVDYCHMRGDRAVSETGFFGLDASRGQAQRFLTAVKRYYLERAFEAHPRWDDSYAFDWIARALPDLTGRDLGERACSEFGDIMPNTVLGPYLAHDKGLHGRKLRLHR